MALVCPDQDRAGGRVSEHLEALLGTVCNDLNVMRKKKDVGWLLYSVNRWFIYYRQVGGFNIRNNPRELLTTNAYALVTRMAEKNDIFGVLVWGGGD